MWMWRGRVPWAGWAFGQERRVMGKDHYGWGMCFALTMVYWKIATEIKKGGWPWGWHQLCRRLGKGPVFSLLKKKIHQCCLTSPPPLSLTGQTRHWQGGIGGVNNKPWFLMKNVRIWQNDVRIGQHDVIDKGGVSSASSTGVHQRQGGVNDKIGGIL